MNSKNNSKKEKLKQEQLQLESDLVKTEDAPPESPQPEDPTGNPEQKLHDAVFVVTNRININEFRSRRIIVPKNAFTSYKADLFEISPNHIPLFRGPISEELLQTAVSSGDNNFPVLIEVNNHLEGSFPPAIGFKDVIAFHFQSERDAKEFPRSYDNIPSDTVDHVVSPELFGGGLQTLTDFTEEAKVLESETGQVNRLHQCDRWSGAVMCANFLLDTIDTEEKEGKESN